MSTTDPDLPPSWLAVTLGQVVNYGATEKAEPEEITPETWVLELEDVERDSSRVVQRVPLSERRSKSTKNRFSRGDVLYGKLRPYLNKVVYADAPGVCTTEIVPIRPGPALVGRYLFHWLRHPEFLRYVTEVSHGVNMPRLGTEAGSRAPFVLAPIREQQRISNKLDTVLARVEACRDRLTRVAPLLKRFRQSVLAAATAGGLTAEWRRKHCSVTSSISAQQSVERSPAELPGGWQCVPLRDLVINMDSHRIPVKAADRAVRRGPYPYYGAFGVIDSIDEYIFDGKFLLLAEDGKNLESRDRSIALIATGKFWVNNHAHVLQARPETNLEYLCAWLNCDRCDLTDLLTGIDQIKLTRGAMDRISVPLPPKAEQDEIVRRVETLFAFADRLEVRLVQAQTVVDRLTPSLLAKAFRGELVPQDPADEPAAELLKRLARQSPDNGGSSRPGPRRGRRPASVQDTP